MADQLLAETGGNPLALLELPRGLSAARLAGGFALPGALSLPGRIEESFLRRLAALPEDTQRLVLVAAAEPTGDPALLWRAAERLGIARPALEPAESAGLIETGRRVRFRHPLVRSVVYRAAGPQQRRRVHRALAGATDPQVDPDRRAWHLAEAATRPDEAVAAELERAAGRAQTRGGLAAAAAFLERAVALTPGRRVARSGRSLRRGPNTRRGRSTRRSHCSALPRPRRSMIASAPGSICCAARSRSPHGGAATRPHCSSKPPVSSKQSTPGSHERPTWKLCQPAGSRVGWRAV